MNPIGDLERFLATNLYPNRVPIALGAAVAIIVLLVVARRRGWYAAARRHPGRSLAALALALAIGGPSAWYLGSPLFIRTALDEPGPTATSTGLPSPAPTGPDTAPGATFTAVTPSPASTGVLAAARSGTFQGADEFHFGSGTATLIETAPGIWTVRFEAFSVRNGPDLYVYVSPDATGYSSDAIEVGRLKATDGNFNMDLPAGAVPSGAASVVIWCKQFAVQFAVAPLGA
ncbi:MAG: DM13 domain-containing protein [Chloroflexi bacterium]|nr:DM13 domain-containing protein [Chloroflexota bacterium]